MEYIALGDLASYLKMHTLSWRELCSMAQTAAAGIGYLHSASVFNGESRVCVCASLTLSIVSLHCEGGR